MIPYSFTSSANVTADGGAFSARADGAVADNARGVGVQAVVVVGDANRDDLDMAGHRATDLTTAAPAKRAA